MITVCDRCRGSRGKRRKVITDSAKSLMYGNKSFDKWQSEVDLCFLDGKCHGCDMKSWEVFVNVGYVLYMLNVVEFQHG